MEALGNLKSDRVVLVSGQADEVAPLRLALEASGIFTVTCLDSEAMVAEGFVADLEVACCSPSRSRVARAGAARAGGDSSKPEAEGDRGMVARMARVARHPMPVIFVHEAPSIWDINYLRSCGAFYVLDRRIEEASDWLGLRDTVACALAVQIQCAFCNRSVEPSAVCLKGNGRLVACRDCVMTGARDLLRSGYLDSKSI